MKMADAENIRRVSEQGGQKGGRRRQRRDCRPRLRLLLRDQPDCFHIFIYAPFEEKVRRLQESGKSEEEATQLVQTVDRDRADFIRQSFGIQFPARHFFHLMVNSTIGEPAAVQTVLDALSAVQKS